MVGTGAAALMAIRVLLDHEVPEVRQYNINCVRLEKSMTNFFVELFIGTYHFCILFVFTNWSYRHHKCIPSCKDCYIYGGSWF